jgi:beta-N-acetylhexosaminidase
MKRLATASARWRHARAREGGGPAARAGSNALAQTIGSPDHLAVATKIAESAMTLVRDTTNALPLARSEICVLTLAPLSPDYPQPDLATALRRYGARVRHLDAGAARSVEGPVVAVTTSRGARDAAQIEAVRHLYREVGNRLVVVGAGDPYDLIQFPEVPTYVAAYGSEECTMDAAARVLLGTLRPRGRLPVTLPGL